MYKVVNASTGLSAASFTERKFALQWAEENNTDETGEYLHLYDVLKVKDASRTHQNGLSAVAEQ